MIRLVLIEDEELMSLGITTAINKQPNMEMVGVASTGCEGIKLVEDYKPDIVLVDIGLPDISGIEVIEQIKLLPGNPKIVVLSSHSSQDIVQAALDKGATSYALKKNNIALVLEAIRATYENKSFFDSDIGRRSFQNFFPQKIKGKTYLHNLTHTEIRIISLMSAGLSNREIAQQMFITESTVKGHSSSIFSKLGVGDRVKAIIQARKLGYIEQDSVRVC
ncbi:two-component response regulator (plasmid) [Trichormus variabilis NIES-23]|uniref:Two-component response regulator n=1 Tax=Trichormus variabilis NIES-23 TaxID=1973479 RepID=A0A1Z4KWA1_ANAVA|nr:two-component response regulator [Trichormus variabilis NIES-23]